MGISQIIKTVFPAFLGGDCDLASRWPASEAEEERQRGYF